MVKVVSITTARTAYWPFFTEDQWQELLADLMKEALTKAGVPAEAADDDVENFLTAPAAVDPVTGKVSGSLLWHAVRLIVEHAEGETAEDLALSAKRWADSWAEVATAPDL
jgi:hypothetical protein